MQKCDLPPDTIALHGSTFMGIMLQSGRKITFTAGFLLALLIVTVILLPSCKKYTDEPGKSDPRLSRKYCNDPEAVNFNRDFPGTADNSVCFYPADAFAGTYNFVDSIYDGGLKFQKEIPFVLTISALTRSKFSLAGFCASGNQLKFTATRSLLANADTTAVSGQIMCRATDTVSGTITQSLTDNTKLTFSLNVITDTGATIHQGTAYRQ